METNTGFFAQRSILENTVARVEKKAERTDTVLNSLRPLLDDADLRREFFQLLKSPAWLEPLDRAGFFEHPQAPERVEGGVRYPVWLASQYLARMATHAPQEVAVIFSRLKIENPSVLIDILNAANKMPADVAASLVPTICEAIEAGALWLHFSNATNFCVQLATESQTDAAMTLAKTLFAPQFGQGEEEPSRRDKHWYMEGLKKVVPVLTAKAPNRFIGDLCDWLTALITAKKHTDPDSGSDYSDVWRPAIEEHEQNRTYDFAGEMVGFVRQAFEQAISDGHLTLDVGLAIVDAVGKESGFSIFERLRVHLINCFAEQAPDSARLVMMDRDKFDESDVKHEYAMLMGQRFPMLSQEDRDAWFGWIDAGPDMSSFDASSKSYAGREPNDDDRQNRIHYWQFNRLHWIRDHLDGGRLDFYKKMFAEHGEPLLADLNSYHSSGWGYESPFTLEELSNLSFDEALDKVNTWRPESARGFSRGPEIEGAAETFGQYVSGKAAEFSAHAEMLEGCQPIYVRTFLGKMTEAVQVGEIDVSAVLRLCRWVVEQPLGSDADEDAAARKMVDKGWRWAREEICRFVETMCKAVSEEGPRYAISDYRETIGGLLEHLTRDPAESNIADEAERQNPRTYDFLTSAINSPRGKGVDALVAYARWVAEHVQREEAGRKIVPNGFGDMPEVKAMLEWQIAAENASCEASAVIGAYISLFYRIDPSWVTENASKIFDLAAIEREPTRAFGWAAWNTFLVWGQAHVDFYRMLRSQYVYAVEHLSEAVLPPNARETPLHHLGEQLVILYGRGNLVANDDEQLLFQFLRAASSDVRSQTIAFVGQSLGNDERVPDAVMERFQKLWDWYWPEWGQKDVQARPQSGLFGSWFTCKQFPVEWRLERLEAFLTSLPMPESAEQIVEHLADIADTHVETATRILDLMVRADKEDWRAYAWHDPAKKILESALRGNEVERGMASQLIDYLGRRGYVEFGELLRGEPI